MQDINNTLKQLLDVSGNLNFIYMMGHKLGDLHQMRTPVTDLVKPLFTNLYSAVL